MLLCFQSRPLSPYRLSSIGRRCCLSFFGTPDGIRTNEAPSALRDAYLILFARRCRHRHPLISYKVVGSPQLFIIHISLFIKKRQAAVVACRFFGTPDGIRTHEAPSALRDAYLILFARRCRHRHPLISYKVVGSPQLFIIHISLFIKKRQAAVVACRFFGTPDGIRTHEAPSALRDAYLILFARRCRHRHPLISYKVVGSPQLFIIHISLFIKKRQAAVVACRFFGTPDGIRTHDLQSRSLTLYPAELRAHISFARIL